jgi:hypothetical protein
MFYKGKIWSLTFEMVAVHGARVKMSSSVATLSPRNAMTSTSVRTKEYPEA